MASLGSMDDVVELLESTGAYRCLRRVPDMGLSPFPEDPSSLRVGVVVDVEATGPDPSRDTPIEIAMVKFAYADGRIMAVLDTLETRGEPPEPLSPEIEELTGIRTADLVGRTIDADAVVAFVKEVNVLTAHNAAYDRAIIERTVAGFPLRPWACSLNDVPWKEEGRRDRRLGDLLYAERLFADGHRAMVDCRSLLHILSLPLPRSGRTAFETMLERARKPTAIFFAERAPYESSTLMKARGYRWLDGRSGAPRCWAVEVPLGLAALEAAFLWDRVYVVGRGAPTMVVVDAMHRYRPIATLAAARVRAPTCEEMDL